MDTAERIALFGGSFDPPHTAHTATAEAAVRQCRLSRLVFIPCRESPLKGKLPGATGTQRVDMLRLATAGLPWAEVSDFETGRPGPSYSWETAAHFAGLHSGAELFWLVGADQWAALDRWARPDWLREHLTFIVCHRGDMPLPPRPGWRAVVIEGKFPGSSTEARARLAAGESTCGLLAPEVAAYAVRAGLYQTPPAGP